MRRIAAALVAVIGLALVPSPASAGAVRHKLTGHVQPSGDISMIALRKANGKRFIKNPIWEAVPITCDSPTGDQTTSGDATGTVFRVKRDRTFTASLSNGQGAFAVIKGKLNRRLTRASGTIRIHGSVPLDSSTTGTACDTGQLSWSAHAQ